MIDVQITPQEQKRNLADLILEQRDKITEARQIIADLVEYAEQNDPGNPHIGRAKGF